MVQMPIASGLVRLTEAGDGDGLGEVVAGFFTPTFAILRTIATMTPTTIIMKRNMMNLEAMQQHVSRWAEAGFGRAVQSIA